MAKEKAKAKTEEKAKVTIDGTDYELDSLSDGAKSQLVNLQLVDQKINTLNQELAFLQTARNAYANALVSDLPFKSDKLPT